MSPLPQTPSPLTGEGAFIQEKQRSTAGLLPAQAGCPKKHVRAGVIACAEALFWAGNSEYVRRDCGIPGAV